MSLQFDTLTHSIDSLMLLFLVITATFYLVFGLDDFFIDVVALLLNLKPKGISEMEMKRLRAMPEKRIAIIMAAWQEGGVIKRMLQGNVGRIRYKNYDFFVGVYPNDPGTRKEAQELELMNLNGGGRVHVVINSMDGPTSKGQMLNEVVRSIFAYERVHGVQFDALLMHDSEDIIHPDALTLINDGMDRYDFLQLPVFSLPVSPFAWVAGTYMDEFSEIHTKDILVREALGAAIPSAGVGTALSRKLVKLYLLNGGGNLLNPKALTEDYELGVSTSRHGLRSGFCCRYLIRADGTREYVATREYFPKSFKRSIRQKSRWTLGIAFQGTENLGWSGKLSDKYFLMRDRKGPLNHLMVAMGFVCWVYAIAAIIFEPAFAERVRALAPLAPALLLNACFMANRILQRICRTALIYGGGRGMLSVVRLPLVNVINAAASLMAVAQFVRSKALGIQPKWIKTEHELPADFGIDESLQPELPKVG